MIENTDISLSIRRLNELYNKFPKDGIYYSKLALLEFCGWIEESMDEIITQCGSRNLKDKTNTKILAEIVERNYSFGYKDNFRKMLMQVIGLVGIEKLETKLDPVKFSQFKSTLGSLKSPRNSAAHTHITGVMGMIDAPSKTKSNFKIVCAGLKDISVNLESIHIKIV